MFWIPNDFFKGYGYFSLVVSFFFLLLQGIVLMGLFYIINDYFVKLSDKSSSYIYLLVAFTVVLALMSLVLIILEFVWFYDCWTNNIVILVPVVFCVIYVVLVIFKFRENASLFTTSAMLFYLVYITWTALASRPTSSCNPFYEKDHGTILQILFGLVFTFATLIVLAAGKKDNDEHMENKLKNVMAEDEDEENELKNENKKSDDETMVFAISVPTIIFQAFMIFVSIYYAMLITNWGRPTVDDHDYDYFIDKWAGFWVKIVCQWTMCALYTFTLIAPKIFKNRDF